MFEGIAGVDLLDIYRVEFDLSGEALFNLDQSAKDKLEVYQQLKQLEVQIGIHTCSKKLGLTEWYGCVRSGFLGNEKLL